MGTTGKMRFRRQSILGLSITAIVVFVVVQWYHTTGHLPSLESRQAEAIYGGQYICLIAFKQ